MPALRLLIFIFSILVVALTMTSAVRSFVLPRASRDHIMRTTFVVVRWLFRLRLWGINGFANRDRILALYAPISLLALLFVWLTSLWIAFAGLFWAAGIQDWQEALVMSGSSLLTLGYAKPETLPQNILAFVEAILGLMLIALLISYLPTIYAAFANWERSVALLEVRAGSPPSAEELFARSYRLNQVDHLGNLWSRWEVWFNEVEESHTSLTPLVFFRSPQPDRSWVTAAGTVLDAAALSAAAFDIPRDVRQELCIRAGYLALRRIADTLHIPYNPDPHFGDPIHVSREEFEIVLNHLADIGIPIKTDREQSWRDFSGWRVNYDDVLLSLAEVTMAPTAPWTSDRQRSNPWNSPWRVK